MPSVGWAVRLCVLVAAVCCAGCPQSKTPSGPNILLITLDTTRADRIGAYGYARARTPVLDRLASEGVLFEQAYAPIPLTLPSHASLMTGSYPPEHGLRTNGAGRLPDEQTTLAELLSATGYRTAAFLASYVLDHKFGLSQGFEVYDDQLAGAEPTQDSIHRYRDGSRVVDAALTWLASERDAPYFCWVHLYDPHAPYDPRSQEFDGAFDDSPYDGEIAYVDRQVGRLIELCRQDPRTIVIVAGDHGEGLGDHSELEHGYTLYRSVLHIPLIVHGVSGSARGTRVSTPVSLLDLFPTILELAGATVPDGLSCQSLVESLHGREVQPRPIYGMTDDPFLQNGWAPLRSLTNGQWRYIRTAKPELYNIDEDPGELVNLAAAHPERLDEMEAALADLESRLVVGEAASVQLSAAEQRALASLGYLGGSSGDLPDEIASLPDVKDMLPFNVLTHQAMDLIEQQRLEEAEAILARVIEESPPEHYVSRLCMASIHEARREVSEAEQIYRRILEARPDNTSALYPLGALCAERGQLGEAIEIFEKCRRLQPDSAQPLYNLGLTHSRAGNVEQAVHYLREAIHMDPHFAGAWAALGNVYARVGATRDAMDAYRRELEFNPASVEANVNLGVLLFRGGQPADAQWHLEKAVQLAPESLEARMNLAICYEHQGNRTAAIRELNAILERQPDHPVATEKLKKLRERND